MKILLESIFPAPLLAKHHHLSFIFFLSSPSTTSFSSLMFILSTFTSFSMHSHCTKRFLPDTCWCIKEWERCGGSQFIHYTMVVALDYKTRLFSKLQKQKHGYMLEPIPLYAIRTIASIKVKLSLSSMWDKELGHKWWH